jgi:hypothetical protein
MAQKQSRPLFVNYWAPQCSADPGTPLSTDSLGDGECVPRYNAGGCETEWEAFLS